MIRTCKLSGVGLLLLCLTGCGDSPANIIHDCLVFWNEACDYMLLASTNERAKDLLDLEFNKLLKAKQGLKGKSKPSKEELAKDKETMADAFFSLVGIYEKQASQGGDEDKVISHLLKYLRDYKGAAAWRNVIAFTKIAEIQWKQSCKGGTVHGSCIKVERQRAVEHRDERSALPAGRDVSRAEVVDHRDP